MGAHGDSFARGRVSYLQIPTDDVTRSAMFYERVFGWRVDLPRGDFEVPGLIGQWVEDVPSVADKGLTIWINVDDIDASLQLVDSSGGSVLEHPWQDGPIRWLARISDPAGNALGIVGHRARREGWADAGETDVDIQR